MLADRQKLQDGAIEQEVKMRKKILIAGTSVNRYKVLTGRRVYGWKKSQAFMMW